MLICQGKFAIFVAFVDFHKKGVVVLFRYDRMNILVQKTGVSKSHICRQLGKSRYYLRNAEKQQTNIQGESLQIIADILGTTPEYLSGETDDNNPSVSRNESGRKETPTDTMAQIMETARRLQPVQQEFFLALLKAAVQNLQEEAPQSQRLWTISQAAVAAGNAATNANIHP